MCRPNQEHITVLPTRRCDPKLCGVVVAFLSLTCLTNFVLVIVLSFIYRYNEGRENRLLYDKALEGLRQWNKDPNFYTGYAKNYISKSVKKGAVDDPRVAYIKDASDLISGCQELLEERVEGFTGKAAGEEGIKRVKEAQKLVGKFLAESGVEGEDADKIAAYVKAH